MPRDPINKKGTSQTNAIINDIKAETQEAVLNLISSNFPPLPQDSLDSDMDIDP